MSQFVHLHLHTDYSLLDGACGIGALSKLAQSMNMPAVAMTDHGSMGGTLEFYKQMSEKKIKPIIGCELNVSPTSMSDRDSSNPDIRGFHLVLLAANFAGYKNLCKLMSRAELEGMFYKPRIDKKLLSEHSGGLLGLSACLGGEIPIAIMRGNIRRAKELVGFYTEVFGKGNFYLELMDHGIEEQVRVNKELVLLSKEFDVRLVATNDVHYLKKEHAKSHDLMLCIQTHSKVGDEKRLKFSCDEFYFKSGEEMAKLFAEIPEALTNTLEVAEKCNLQIPIGSENHYPVYSLPEGQNPKEYLREICLGGIPERYAFDPKSLTPGADPGKDEVIRRMDFELGVIEKSNYVSYFLIVWDFLKYAREQGISVGPGRGSGAGSIVAYLSGITDIDPLRYSLLFERFLNPERVSPPDFDIDLCERRRYEVIEYVRNKYGSENVAQIGTYGTLKTKAVLKDIMRVLGRSMQESNTLTKLIPDKVAEGSDSKEVTLDYALKNSSELREFMEKEPWVKEVFDYAAPLEKLNRNRSIHAAGVIIGDQPIENVVPLGRGTGSEVITQYTGPACESLGLLKMDFLGLRTLTLIEDAVENISRSRPGTKLNIERIPIDDKPTFDLLNKGDTIAVFQLESPGMQDLCKKFGIHMMEDIIALIALYRPGPMDFIPEFISRKMGHVSIEYDHPLMEKVLKETYGIMLYQEQIMEVVQKLAGFTLGGADILRRAIGKKKHEEMQKQRDKFVKGCGGNGIAAQTAEAIWEKINKFAGYGFNKSHSAAYAFTAYRSAYLKANYPPEFMCAVLTSEMDAPDKIAFFIQECKKMDIAVLPPNVNSSDMSFSVDNGSIRFGLAAIKGVGANAAKKIIETRDKCGKFESILDFCEKTGGSVNSRMLESLIKAGAFDCFKVKRSQLFAVIDEATKLAAAQSEDRSSGQSSLFDLLPSEERESLVSVNYPDIPEFDQQDMLKSEKDLLGFYVTGHPLGEHAELIRKFSTRKLADILTAGRGGIRVGGIIENVEVRPNKKGENFASFRIENLEGSANCIAFNEVFAKSKDLIVNDSPIFIEGFFESRNEETPKIIVTSVCPFFEATERYTEEIVVILNEGNCDAGMLCNFKNTVLENPGTTPLVLRVTSAEGDIAFIESAKKYFVTSSGKLIRLCEAILGKNCTHILAKKESPPPQPRQNNFQRGRFSG